VEFLVDAQRNFYFLEMNTRLQVEHPVTEWVTGVDLVAWQLHVAQGGVLPLLKPIAPRGHAIEVRVYAEDPATNFMPSPGTISYVRVPSGPGVRDDSAVFAGYRVPNFYDPMISKLSVWAPTRMEAILKMRRALDEYVLTGITTNLRYLKQIVLHPEFVKGDYDTGFLGRAHQTLLGEENAALTRVSMIAAAMRAHQRAEKQQATIAATHQGSGSSQSAWRSAGRRQGSWKKGA
jgi:acetyl-CoA carboxylase biotin carboxylase subunit